MDEKEKGSGDPAAPSGRGSAYWYREGRGDILYGLSHGLHWALDLLAQAIEERRAETGTGSVHESAVPEGDAPKPPSGLS